MFLKIQKSKFDFQETASGTKEREHKKEKESNVLKIAIYIYS